MAPEGPQASPARIKMPITRPGITWKNACGAWEFYVIVNFYDVPGPNTRMEVPGEVFVHIAKEGSVVGGMCNALAATISLALQHGVPWSVLRKQYLEMRFEPNGTSLDGTREYPSIIHAIADTVDSILAYRESLWGDPTHVPPISESGDGRSGVLARGSDAAGVSTAGQNANTDQPSGHADDSASGDERRYSSIDPPKSHIFPLEDIPTKHYSVRNPAPVEIIQDGIKKYVGTPASSQAGGDTSAQKVPPASHIGAGGRIVEPEIFPETPEVTPKPQIGGKTFDTLEERERLLNAKLRQAMPRPIKGEDHA